MAKLAFSNAVGQRQDIELGPHKPVVVVGRLAECDIRTADNSVSRRHSQFMWRHQGADEVVEVQDLGSSNGTFVNDQQVSGATMLHNGDRVRCGNFQIDFTSTPRAVAPMGPGGDRLAGPPSPGLNTTYGPGASLLGQAGYGPPGHGAPPPMGPPPGPPSSASSDGPGGIPYVDDPSLALNPADAMRQFGTPEQRMTPPPSNLPPTLADHSGYAPPPMSGPPPLGGPPPSSHDPYGAPDPYRAPSQPSPPPSYAPPPSYGAPQAEYRSDLDRSHRASEAMAREIDSLRYENQQLRSGGQGGYDPAEVRRLQGELRRLQDELAEMEELRKEEARLRAQNDALSDRNMELKEQYTGLQEQQSDLRDKLREAREDLDNALFKRDELAADVERLEKDKVELFDQLTKLKIEYNHLERANEQTQKEYGLLEYEYKRLDEANQDLERELRATAADENEQSDSIRRLQAIVEEKEATVRDLRERIEDLREELNDREDDNQWMVEVERLKRENDELAGERTELKERIDALQEIVSSQKAAATASAEEQSGELISLRDEVERLRNRLKDRVAAETFNAVQEEADRLRVQLKAAQEELGAAKASGSSASEELLSQIRTLEGEKRELEIRLRDLSATHSTSPGSVPTLSGVSKEKVRDAFESINGMVSGWRANLETMQIHVGDLTGLIGRISGMPLGAEAKSAIDESDPQWACESMGETVKQILGDSKRIKSLLIGLRDEFKQD